MFHHVKSSSDVAIELLSEKENVARVLRGFKIIVDDFM